jgi:tRNA pseudouridine65 synthase
MLIGYNLFMQKTQEEPLEILYQDSDMVIVNKPSGLLVHKSPIDKKEHRFALQEVRNQIGRYVYPVHRIDKPTSGILLFALTKEVAQKLSLAFVQGEIEKSYLAVARGYTDIAGEIHHPLKQMLDTKEQKAKGVTKEPQEAHTSYRRLATLELPYEVSRYPVARYSLVWLSPHTGRKHQLRRHLKHIHHHLIGDTKHGRGEHNRLFREHLNIHRLLLHAYTMRLKHPTKGYMLTIVAPLDDSFCRIVERFGYDLSLAIRSYL